MKYQKGFASAIMILTVVILAASVFYLVKQKNKDSAFLVQTEQSSNTSNKDKKSTNEDVRVSQLGRNYICSRAAPFTERFIHLAKNGVVAETIVTMNTAGNVDNTTLILAGNVESKVLRVATPEQYFKLNYDSCVSAEGKTLFDDYAVQYGTSSSLKILTLSNLSS